jgi:hypothetical protein
MRQSHETGRWEMAQTRAVRARSSEANGPQTRRPVPGRCVHADNSAGEMIMRQDEGSRWTGTIGRWGHRDSPKGGTLMAARGPHHQEVHS